MDHWTNVRTNQYTVTYIVAPTKLKRGEVGNWDWDFESGTRLFHVLDSLVDIRNLIFKKVKKEKRKPGKIAFCPHVTGRKLFLS